MIKSAAKLISIWKKSFADIGYVFINDIDKARLSYTEKEFVVCQIKAIGDYIAVFLLKRSMNSSENA